MAKQIIVPLLAKSHIQHQVEYVLKVINDANKVKIFQHLLQQIDESNLEQPFSQLSSIHHDELVQFHKLADLVDQAIL